MASTTLFVNYRPLRIGLCVRHDSIEDITKAAELNTLLWGGIYNPIIPVTPNTEFASQLVKLFLVDLLYPISHTTGIDQFIESQKHLQWRNPYDKLLFHQFNKELRMGVLDVSNIINHYWETEFKNRKRSNCILPAWSKYDPLAPIFTLEFGNYPEQPKLSYDHRMGYLKGLRGKTHRIVKGKAVDVGLYGKMMPIFVTEDRLSLSGSNWGWESHGIYLGEPDNPVDLISFWNLRAAAINLHFVPLNDVGRVKDFIKKHVDRVYKRDAAQRFPKGLGFWYRSEIGEDTVKKVAKELVEEGKTRSHCRISEHLWNGLNVRPPKPEFESETVLANVDVVYGTPSVSFQLPEKPAEKGRDNSNQDLVVEIHPLGEFEYEGYTLKLPFLPDLNEWYSRNVVFDPDELRVGKDELGVITDIHDGTLTLHPLKNQEVIKQIFGRCQIDAKPSKPGLIAQRLVERMGDLDDCRVFKVHGVRKLISSLSPTKYVTHSAAIQKIRDLDNNGKPSFDNHKSLHIQGKNTPDLSPQEVFDYLLEKNVFTAGLVPICPNCQLEFWLSLRDADEQVKCEYCGYEFKIATQLRDRGDFRFRRSGLFGRTDNQEGSIPVILTLLQLLRRSGMSRLMHSTGLKLDSRIHGINCEIDLVVVDKKSFEDKVAVLIGECKTRDEISEQDIQNMTKVKQVLDESGVETYLLFSKTSEFTKEELQRFYPLAAQDIYPIIFTATELEPYDPYDYYHKNNIKLSHIYTHQFDEMGQNSFEIYLKKEMKNALILHGTGNNSRGNWFPWLKGELEKRGYEVWSPDLPRADKPNIKRYNDYILGNSSWVFNEKSVLVGHSSGAVAILGLLQHLRDTVVDTCILVGSFKDNLGSKDFDGLFEDPYDFKKIKKHAKRFVFIHSNNDPYCPLDHAKYLAKKLGGKLIIKKGQGHFNLEVGEKYKQFPFILEVLKK